MRRVLAPNPSPFTYTGTQTYIVGLGDGCAAAPVLRKGIAMDRAESTTASAR